MKTIDEEIKTKFRNNRHRFIANLVFTSNCFQNLVVDFLKPYDISPQQYNILSILRGAGTWVTMNSIKEVMVDKSPNTTRLSDKLLDKGLVERKRSETDRRVVYLSITNKGKELLKKLDEDDSGCHLEYFNRISEEDAIHFSNLLDRLRG